jgi:hypothetical protein
VGAEGEIIVAKLILVFVSADTMMADNLENGLTNLKVVVRS